MLKIKDAITSYEIAVKSNSKWKDLLDQFIGKPETDQIETNLVNYFLVLVCIFSF